ncbi:hypothetical protein IWW57_004016, partial [Coemansia sp. S610]
PLPMLLRLTSSRLTSSRPTRSRPPSPRHLRLLLELLLAMLGPTEMPESQGGKSAERSGRSGLASKTRTAYLTAPTLLAKSSLASVASWIRPWAPCTRSWDS